MTPAAMARLHAACFTSPRPWSEAEIADLLTSPLVFAIPESGGFAMGRAVAGEAELLTLAVDPGQRRQGIGAALLSGFLAEAKAREAERAFLEVNPDNDPAVSLYLKAGFTITGRRKGYYHPPTGPALDALIMDLRLQGSGGCPIPD